MTALEEYRENVRPEPARDRPPIKAIVDGYLVYKVPSLSNPKETYTVDLESYRGHGACDCKDFACRKAPLLDRMITPQQAVRDKLVRVKEGITADMALTCVHIRIAREQFCSDVIAAIIKQRKPNQ